METDVVFAGEEMSVLVVDDNEVNTMVVASMLEQYSMLVTEVYSGKEAIEKVRHEDFDIIFMDYLMPEMNGIETTEEIRKLGKVKRPVIVALSANVTTELKENCRIAGVDDVLEKPLELDKLCAILKKWMPDKMISEEAIQMVEQGEGNLSQKLVELFADVEGLDVEKGLSHLANSAENYIKVIEAAVENIRTEARRLQVFRVSLVQPTSMKNSFHSLKGVFINLGVKHLSERSQFFELAGSDDASELDEVELSRYLELLHHFLDGLEKGLRQYDEKYAVAVQDRFIPITEEEYKECYELLIYYLEKYEYNELQQLNEPLRCASKGEIRKRFEEAGHAIQSFQYEEALDILKDIQERSKEE